MLGRGGGLLAPGLPLDHRLLDRGEAAEAQSLADGAEGRPGAFGVEFVGGTPDRFGGEGHGVMSFDRMMIQIVSYNILRSEEHTSELQSLMRIQYAVFCLKK